MRSDEACLDLVSATVGGRGRFLCLRRADTCKREGQPKDGQCSSRNHLHVLHIQGVRAVRPAVTNHALARHALIYGKF